MTEPKINEQYLRAAIGNVLDDKDKSLTTRAAELTRRESALDRAAKYTYAALKDAGHTATAEAFLIEIQNIQSCRVTWRP